MSKLFILCFFLLSLEAFTIESSYEGAHQKALQEKKTLLVFLVQKECASCLKELAKIVTDRRSCEIISKKAVFTIVTQEQKKSYPIELLYTLEFPSLFFLDNNELYSCDTQYGTIELVKIQECLLTE